MPSRVDKEGSGVEKNGKLLYGYRRHYLSDSKEGLVLSVHTTAAHAHQSSTSTPVFSKYPSAKEVEYWQISDIVLLPMNPYYALKVC